MVGSAGPSTAGNLTCVDGPDATAIVTVPPRLPICTGVRAITNSAWEGFT
jgi:hypothetical protein